MDPRSFPTKGNLILAKNSLTLARQGYELMDKKRNILIRELMGLIDEAKDIQEEIDVDAERERLQKELTDTQAQIERLEKLLNSPFGSFYSV